MAQKPNDLIAVKTMIQYKCMRVQNCHMILHAKHLVAKIDTLLLEAGSNRKQMLRATVWLSDMNLFVGLNEIWNAWVPEGHAPARACGEAKLARAELMVEIIVDAAYN